MQGFQLLVDWDSGFGAVASALAQEVEDEFGAKGVMALAATPLAHKVGSVGNGGEGGEEGDNGEGEEQ